MRRKARAAVKAAEKHLLDETRNLSAVTQRCERPRGVNSLTGDSYFLAIATALMRELCHFLLKLLHVSRKLHLLTCESHCA